MVISTEGLLATAATVTAILIIIGAAGKFYRIARKVEKAIGEDKDGRSVSERLGRVEHQVFPNGGGSLSDQVKEVKEAIAGVQAKTDTIEHLLNTLVQNERTRQQYEVMGTPPPRTVRTPAAKKTKPTTK